MILGVKNVDAEQASATINILLKYQSDIAKAVKEFQSEGSTWKKGSTPAKSG
jgi:head-tail adaptor